MTVQGMLRYSLASFSLQRIAKEYTRETMLSGRLWGLGAFKGFQSTILRYFS